MKELQWRIKSALDDSAAGDDNEYAPRAASVYLGRTLKECLRTLFTFCCWTVAWNLCNNLKCGAATFKSPRWQRTRHDAAWRGAFKLKLSTGVAAVWQHCLNADNVLIVQLSKINAPDCQNRQTVRQQFERNLPTNKTNAFVLKIRARACTLVPMSA